MAQEQKSKTRPVVPRQYSGQWIAWSQDGSRIVASGQTLAAARAAALAAGQREVGYEWVPPANTRIVGGCR